MLAEIATIASVVLELIKLVRQIKKEKETKVQVRKDLEKLKTAFKNRDADMLNELFSPSDKAS